MARMRPETSSILWYSHHGVLMSLTDGSHQTQWEKVDCFTVKDMVSGRDGRSDWDIIRCSQIAVQVARVSGSDTTQSEDLIKSSSLPHSYQGFLPARVV